MYALVPLVIITVFINAFFVLYKVSCGQHDFFI
jgi:hypothetical protein